MCEEEEARARSDRGTATQAIEWVLNVNVDEQHDDFLRAWQQGNAEREWPEFFEWLDHQAHPATPELPDGMVHWAGGERAPEDWDGDAIVRLRSGLTMRQADQAAALEWRHRNGKWAHGDIIAYTPKPAAPQPDHAGEGLVGVVDCPICRGDGRQPICAVCVGTGALTVEEAGFWLRAQKLTTPTAREQPATPIPATLDREAVNVIRDLVRLADMGFEASLREPEENGNYATYERAKRFLAAVDRDGEGK